MALLALHVSQDGEGEWTWASIQRARLRSVEARESGARGRVNWRSGLFGGLLLFTFCSSSLDAGLFD